jgi:hypothetical protein
MATTELAICKLALRRIGITKTILATDGIDGASTNADASVEAQNCAFLFDDVRDAVLGTGWWPFAKKWGLLALVNAAEAAYVAGTTYAAGAYVSYGDTSYVSLQAANTGHTPGAVGSELWWGLLHDSYGYVYTVPSDCVQPRFIYSGLRPPREDQKIEFAVESKRLLTGGRQIVTDLENASLVYTARVETVSVWPEEFCDAVAWRLASELAMPLTKKTDVIDWCFKRSEMAAARGLTWGLNAQQEPPEADTASVAARSSS